MCIGRSWRRAARAVWHLVLAVACVTGVAGGVLGASPGAAFAGWPLEDGASRVALGFGASYTSGDGSAQHRGVDLQAAPGSRVLAPLAGRVTFAGHVPAVGGGRVLAVTIETARGRVTLLPLVSAGVAAGDDLAEGAAVGTLAIDGDGSSAGTHLHVGVRDGDLYVDPLGVLAPPVAPGGGAGEGVTAGVGSGVTAGATGGVSVGGGGVSAGSGVVSAAGGRVPVTGGMPAGVSLAPRPAPRTNSRVRTQPSAPGSTAAARVGARVRGGFGVTSGAGGAAAPVVLRPGGVYLPATGAAQATARPGGDTAVFAWLAEHARAYVKRTARFAMLLALGMLAGIGTLWPLWRGAGRKGVGQLGVRAVGDDVAAVPSR